MEGIYFLLVLLLVADVIFVLDSRLCHSLSKEDKYSNDLVISIGKESNNVVYCSEAIISLSLNIIYSS